LVGTLQDIVEKVEKENLQPPSVVVVGDVVQLRKNLRWFDK
jgi:uroporphyrinogen III methyltransferase/synthase